VSERSGSPGPPLDVLVIGAGPAGLYAAQHLARSGLSVRVLEEHEQIGEPVHCTGILGTEAFALPGLPADVVLGRPHVGRFQSPSGLELEYAGPRGEVCVIDRGAFDRGLAGLAARAGAEISTGSRAVALDVERGRVTVRAARRGRLESVVARLCVLACGARYEFQRRLGWGTPPVFLGSAQTEAPASESEVVRIFLRPEVAPSGFGWFVPIRRNDESRAKVGVMAAARARQTLGVLVRDLTAAGHVTPARAPVVTRLLPLAPLARTAAARVLAVGDAAGLVKPTTGGGIYYSLLSARWAADTIAAAFHAGDFSAAALGAYEETWRARLWPELRAGMRFRRLLGWLAPTDLDDLARLGITDGLIPLIRATARFNWHRDLIVQSLRHPGVLQILMRRMVPAAVGLVQ
jgi:geranylgeranyl reductase family protein